MHGHRLDSLNQSRPETDERLPVPVLNPQKGPLVVDLHPCPCPRLPSIRRSWSTPRWLPRVEERHAGAVPAVQCRAEARRNFNPALPPNRASLTGTLPVWTNGFRLHGSYQCGFGPLVPEHSDVCFTRWWQAITRSRAREQDLRQRTSGKRRPLLPPDRRQEQGPVVVRPCRILAVPYQPAGFHRQALFGDGNSLYWVLDDTSGRTAPPAHGPHASPEFRPAGADHGPVPTLITPLG